MATAIQNPTNVQPLEDSEQNLPSFRSPPHNFEAEKALLGAIFANNNAYDRVSGYLRPEQFADPVHGRIYDATSKLIERGQIADPITLRTFFERDGSIADVGGTRYLAEIAGSMVNVINAGEYGRTIYDLHLKRQLIELGEQIVNRAFTPEVEDDAMHQIGNAEQQLYDLATTGEIEGGFQEFKTSIITAIEMAEAAHKKDGKLSGVSTGLRDIDGLLGGLHPSDLVILAGRPSMGKTAFSMNLAENAAIQSGKPVLAFSMEMPGDSLAMRMLSSLGRIDQHRIRTGKLHDEDWPRITSAVTMLSNAPLFIDDAPALSPAEVRARA
ncbi:MAG: DnaB-like helicase C-terminal domain-containing protein, partial [Rhodospirillales bacterium]|nr:DnaB-like helicase C-terminal domain-containing protein [Rhodospirillales bacterium]